jgi:hypothetical protein
MSFKGLLLGFLTTSLLLYANTLEAQNFVKRYFDVVCNNNKNTQMNIELSAADENSYYFY